jgi:hypothetical protein
MLWQQQDVVVDGNTALSSSFGHIGPEYTLVSHTGC